MLSLMRKAAMVLLSLGLLACDESGSQGVGAGASSGGTSAVGGQEATGGNEATGGSSSGGASLTGGSASTTSGGAGGEGPEDPGSMISDARLYTTDGSEYVIDEVGQAFAHAAAGANDNLIFYVHGRGCGGGGEPEKSLADAMPELEADYGSRAILFNWQGSDAGCPLGFPEAEARASGAAFAHTLHKLAFFKFQNPSAFAGLRLTLITHSMGSLVLEEALLNDDVALPATLFDTALIGSAASARDGHATWLDKATLSPVLYVSVNGSDSVLAAAAVLGGARLGRSLDGSMLSAGAVYVDFTASDVNHAHYLHSGQNGAHMRAFYDTVMNGLPFDFAAASGIASVETRDGTSVYHFDGQ